MSAEPQDVLPRLLVIMILMGGAQQPPLCQTRVEGLAGLLHAMVFLSILDDLAHALLDAPQQY